MSHETPNHFEVTGDSGATSTSSQPMSSTNRRAMDSSAISTKPYSSSNRQTMGSTSTFDPITSSGRDGQFGREANWAPSQRDSADRIQDDKIRRGSGSTEPLSLTAASDRIDQDKAHYSDHRGSLPQNAPGKPGSIGEAAVGALGFGGSTVERPKEDQGLGEKIVNFFGA